MSISRLGAYLRKSADSAPAASQAWALPHWRNEDSARTAGASNRETSVKAKQRKVLVFRVRERCAVLSTARARNGSAKVSARRPGRGGSSSYRLGGPGKSEARSPKSEGTPKPEIRILQLVDPSPLGQGGVPSGFGLRVCFGFRPSDFGLSL